MVRFKDALVFLTLLSVVYGTPLGMKAKRNNLGKMEETLKQTSESEIPTANITASDSCNLDKKAKDEARKSCPPDDDPDECPADQETIESCCKCFRFCCDNDMSNVEARQMKQLSSSSIIFPEEQVVSAKSTNRTSTTSVSDPMYGSTSSTESKKITTTKSSALDRVTRSTKSMNNKKTEELEVSKATKATKGTSNKNEKDETEDAKLSESDEKLIKETVAEAASEKVQVALNKLASALKNVTEDKNMNNTKIDDGEGFVKKEAQAVSCSSLKSSGSISVQPSNMKGVNCSEHNILDEFFPPKSNSGSNKTKRTKRGTDAKDKGSKTEKTTGRATDNPASTTESLKIDEFIPTKPNRSKRSKENKDDDDLFPAKAQTTTSTTEASILDQFIPPTKNGSSGTGEATKSGRSKRSPGEVATSQLTVVEIEEDKQRDNGGVLAVGKIRNTTEARGNFITASIDHGAEGIDTEIKLSPPADGYDEEIQKSANYREPGSTYSEYDRDRPSVSSSGSLIETFPSVQINTTTINRVKSGRCQSITGGKQCISLGPDASQCSMDGQCEGTKKCCFYGCAPYNRVGICDLPSFY